MAAATRVSSSMSNYSDVDEKEIEKILEETSDESSRSRSVSNRPGSAKHGYSRHGRRNLWSQDSEEELGMTGSMFLKSAANTRQQERLDNSGLMEDSKAVPPIPIQASLSSNNSYSASINKSNESPPKVPIQVPIGQASIDYEEEDFGRPAVSKGDVYTSGGIGQDTLEEIEDKARFFKEVENSSDSVDYSQLNRQLQGQETMKSLIENEPKQESPGKMGQAGGTGDDIPAEMERAKQSRRHQSSNRDKQAHRLNANEGNLLGKVELESTESAILGKKSLAFSQNSKDSDDFDTHDGGSGGAHSMSHKHTMPISALTGTSTQLEAMHRAFEQVRNSQDARLGVSTSAGEEASVARDTGSYRQTLGSPRPGLVQSFDEFGASSEYSEKNAMRFEPQSESRGFDLQPATGTIGYGASQSLDDSRSQNSYVELDQRKRPQLAPSLNQGLPSRANNVPFMLKSILKNSTSGVQPKSGLSPETMSKSVLAKSKEPKKTHTKRLTSKSPDKRRVLKQQTADSSVIRHSSPKSRTVQSAVKKSGSGIRSRPAVKNMTGSSSSSPKESPKNRTVGSRFEREDEGVYDHYHHMGSGEGVHDLSPIRPQRGPKERISRRSPSSTSPRKFSETELVLVDQMKEEMRMKEINWRRKEEQLLKEFQAQMQHLNQENFALKSQLQSAMEDQGRATGGGSPVRGGGATSQLSPRQLAYGSGGSRGGGKEKQPVLKLPHNVSEAQWLELKQQLSEQEALISGYQKENERLYEEIKTLKSEPGAVKDKSATAAMFKENQKLLKEIGNLRDLLDDRDTELRSMQQMMMTSSPPESASNKRSAPIGGEEQPIRASLLSSNHNLRHSSTSPLRRSPSPSAKGKPAVGSPVSAYVNNRTVEKMRLELLEKRDYIDRLESSVKELQHDLATEKANAVAQREKDAASIRELQWQLNQLEKRWMLNANRDSVSTLIRGGGTTSLRATSPSKNVATALEEKVQRLEAELASTTERSKESILNLEQKYAGIKTQYEFKLKKLESELSVARNELTAAVLSPKPAAVPGNASSPSPSPDARLRNSVALEQELEAVRQKANAKTSQLEKEVSQLRKQLAEANRLSSKSVKAGESAASVSNTVYTNKGSQFEKKRSENVEQRLRSLLAELDGKNREIANLRVQLKRALSNQSNGLPQSVVPSQVADRQTLASSLGKTFVKAPERPALKGILKNSESRPTSEMISAEKESLPELKMPDNPVKEYDPSIFSGQTFSEQELVLENEQLKEKLERLECMYKDKLSILELRLAETESKLANEQQAKTKQASDLISAHENQIKQLVIQHASDYSTSKVAQMQSKISTQEVLIKHLREQLLASTALESELTAYAEKERQLETKIETLTSQISKLKESQTPSSRQYEKVLDKLDALQKKYETRERELKEIISSNSHLASTEEIAAENQRLKLALKSKTEETAKFKVELDTMLQLLQSLKTQNVSLPVKLSALKDQLDSKVIT